VRRLVYVQKGTKFGDMIDTAEGKKDDVEVGKKIIHSHPLVRVNMEFYVLILAPLKGSALRRRIC
jgi:hypothetical protein